MLTFCPNCSNMLILSRARPPAPPPSTTAIIDADAADAAAHQPYRFECRACPYEYVLRGAWRERRLFEPKRAGDVVGGAASWENVDRTAVNCADEACPGTEAYFMQVQIRSADEPMTSFYKCTVCGKQWRD